MNIQTSINQWVRGAFFVCALTLASSAHAEGPIIRSGETVGIESNQVLEGDFYAFGQTITLSGKAEHDVLALGAAVTINAPVTEDLVVLGGVVQVHGTVGDDVRVLGGEVVIAEPIQGDLVVLGGTVHMLSTASVGGDLIFFGGEIRIDGPVTGGVYGTGEVVRIDASVGKNVSIRAGVSLTLGDNANIVGDVAYASRAEVVRAQGAVVSGTVNRDMKISSPEGGSPWKSLVLNVLVIMFSTLTVFFIARGRTKTLVAVVREGYGRLGLIGLGMTLALPLAGIILMTSVIGFVVGLALLFGYIVLMIIALMTLPILFGSVIERFARKDAEVTIITILLGTGAFIALPFIPYVGGLVFCVGLLMLVGALCNELYRFFKQ